MSDYQKLIRDEAKSFFDLVHPDFERDAGEFGGGSAAPNLAKWLDRTRKLESRMTEVTSKWGRADIERIKSNSKNALKFGDPKESASTAFMKDLVNELKRLKKAQTR